VSAKISNWLERWQRALRDHHALLFDYQTKSIKLQYAEKVNCPVCDSTRSDLYFEKDWFQYVQCQDCSMVFMNPRLNQEATYAFYNSEANAIYNETKFDQVSISPCLDDQINYANLNLIDHYRTKSGGDLLEIGSAKGFFLSKAKERGYNVYGIELNKKNAEFSRQLVGNTVFEVDLFDACFDSGKFDVIYMRDVIEHIPNPQPFFRELNRIAKPGAIIFIETHNIDGLINQIVREKHTVIFGFEHPNHWSPKTLGKALLNNGYEVQKVYHSSLDFTLNDILSYFCAPTFTTIMPRSVSRSRHLLLKLLRWPFWFRPIGFLDRTITSQIANHLKKGSVIKVIAEKRKELSV
jgi:2-polyprenyl-3-methyl-5-hydroxy-6-metoxy-1,4-benzoquinol methylase